jgi:hypothetical protein
MAADAVSMVLCCQAGLLLYRWDGRVLWTCQRKSPDPWRVAVGRIMAAAA